jgi:HD-GYP domain-containing protein (c-di-GMP phosphodiesterase class II)
MYQEIPASLVSLGDEYDFDIYLRINNTHRLFAARGARLSRDHQRILRLKDTRVFVPAEDIEIARRQLHQIRHRRASPSSESPEKKADRIYGSVLNAVKVAYQGLVPRTITDMEKSADELARIILSDEKVIESLKLIETTDHFTYRHSMRVGIYSTALLLKLMGSRLTPNQIRKISTGYFLHDIGMVRVPMQILEKTGELSESEWRLVRMHPIWGRDCIIKSEYLSLETVNIILAHHERSDGSGYPYGKTGDEIPPYARVCAIADAYESLTASRPYRAAHEPFEALKIMYKEMAHTLDADLFPAFVNLLGPVT